MGLMMRAPRLTISRSGRTTGRLALVALASLAPLVGVLTQQPARAQHQGAGEKGAQIYCFMRDNGNNHQVSWDAAYEVIKRQGNQLFRTSPQHAAVMITEAVVQNPADFPDCGRYLGDLFTRSDSSTGGSRSGATRPDRYGY